MQLEHCPFCGTKHSLSSCASGRHQQIICGACGARGPEVFASLPYATAVESWNVRQGPSTVNETHRPHGVSEGRHQGVCQNPPMPQSDRMDGQGEQR
jgi:hypothetical protein